MRQYHLQLADGDAGRYVLLPGDPGRCERIAAHLDDSTHVASNREYTTWRGSLDGELVGVCSTGIGGPSAAIAVEELCRVGATTLIRVGSCGAMQPGMRRGDVVVVTGAARDEGTSSQYVPVMHPAIANLDVVVALRDAARDSNHRHHLGVVWTKDAFYAEMEPQSVPVATQVTATLDALRRAGCLAAEMECAAILTVAALRGLRAGAVVAVVNEAAGGPEAMPDHDALPVDATIEIAIAGLRRLIATDRRSSQAG